MVGVVEAAQPAYSSGTELGTTGRQLTVDIGVSTGLIDAPTSTVDAPMLTLLQVDSCASTVDAYASTEELTLSPSSPTHPHSHTQVR